MLSCRPVFSICCGHVPEPGTLRMVSPSILRYCHSTFSCLPLLRSKFHHGILHLIVLCSITISASFTAVKSLGRDMVKSSSTLAHMNLALCLVKTLYKTYIWYGCYEPFLWLRYVHISCHGQMLTWQKLKLHMMLIFKASRLSIW